MAGKIKKALSQRPFLYREIIMPGFLKTIIYFHSLHQSQYPDYLISFVPIDIFGRS